MNISFRSLVAFLGAGLTALAFCTPLIWSSLTASENAAYVSFGIGIALMLIIAPLGIAANVFCNTPRARGDPSQVGYYYGFSAFFLGAIVLATMPVSNLSANIVLIVGVAVAMVFAVGTDMLRLGIGRPQQSAEPVAA